MVVNSKKTAMICISAATDYTADAFIMDADQNRIGFTDKIKARGMHFSNRLDIEAHVQHVIKAVNILDLKKIENKRLYHRRACASLQDYPETRGRVWVCGIPFFIN